MDSTQFPRKSGSIREMAKKTDEKSREIPVRFVGESEELSESADAESADATREEMRTASEAQSADDNDAAGDPPAGTLTMEDDPEVVEPGAPPGKRMYELMRSLTAAEGQVESLTQEKTALYDQLLRRQAEFENYRKRAERERGEFYQRTRADLLLELLPVLDNFERALVSLERSEGDAEALRHGVELIHKQFKDALTKLGLQPVEAVGHSFDPNVHEAVTTEQTDQHEENTVIEEFERGYKLGDRLLRPAKVKVATAPSAK
jgi:molecular chaperone GrpE